MARLIHSFMDKILQKPSALYGWSDSETTLAWLRGHPSRWKTFVANRVSEVITLLPDTCWKYVPTSENPADLATKPRLLPIDLQNCPLWWTGPAWLSKGPSSWPRPISSTYQTDEEA